MTLRFLSVLLRAAPKEQREYFARQLPTAVFSENKPHVKWVNAYRLSHGTYPTVAAFKARFPGVELPSAKKETVASALKPILDQESTRKINALYAELQARADSGADMDQLVEFMRSEAQQLPVWGAQYKDSSFLDGSIAHRAYLDRQRNRVLGTSYAKPSPWSHLNNIMGYFDVGEYLVFASRTSIGKTWVLLKWADYLDLKGERVLFVSKEMPTELILQRMEAIRFGINYERFREGTLDPQELGTWRRARYAFEKKRQTQLVVTGHEDLAGVGFDHIYSRLETYKPTVLIVDGGYLLTMEVPRGFGKPEMLTRISNQFARIAKHYKIRVMVTLQMNRDAEPEDQKGHYKIKGGLRNISGSDSWAQDANFVVSLRGGRGTDSRVMEVEKGRDSKVGSFSLGFSLEPPKFKELIAAQDLIRADKGESDQALMEKYNIQGQGNQPAISFTPTP